MMNEKLYDVIVIGGGPAGLTAALYLARAGCRTLVLEKRGYGGQIALTNEVVNYPGVPKTSGMELTDTMRRQAEDFGAEFLIAEARELSLFDAEKTVKTSAGDFRCIGVLLATGAQPKMAGFRGEEEFRGRGVSYCATCDGNFFRGKDVAVIGGGNTAVADVIYLARICRKVYLVHRRDKLRATAIYHQRLAELDNVELCWDSVATEFLTENEERPRVSGLRIHNQKTDGVRDLAVSAVFIAVGTTPNTEFLGGALALDAGGYIIADGTGRTATADVFAAGDVRTKELRQVVTAVADGANCAESAADFLSA